MSDHDKRITEDEVESLVAAYLTHEQEATDAVVGLARVRASLVRASADSQAPNATSSAGRAVARPWRMVRRAVWGVAAALVVSLLVIYAPSAQANAAALVREAKKVHALPEDRCYAVETRLEEYQAVEVRPLFEQTRTNLLWTRGDRFWIESVGNRRRFAWGRDERGSVWLAVSPKRGIRFEPEEVGEQLGLWCDMLSMRIESMLDDILGPFDLHSEQAAVGIRRVRATPKPGYVHPRLLEAVLEIDMESKVLRKVILTKIVRNGLTATSTYTLVETWPQPDTVYQLEGQLDADAKIFSKTDTVERRRALTSRRFDWRAFEKENP